MRMTGLTSAAGGFAACIKPRTSADAGVAAKNAQAENPQTMAQAAPALAGNPCNSDKAILFAWKLLNRSSPNRSSPSRRETQPKLGILMELTAFRHGLDGLHTSPVGIMANRQQI
jgi:hypothetical protein